MLTRRYNSLLARIITSKATGVSLLEMGSILLFLADMACTGGFPGSIEWHILSVWETAEKLARFVLW